MKHVIVILLCFCSSLAVANESIKLSAMEQFQNERDLILNDLKSNTIYREISNGDKNTVEDALDEMTLLIGEEHNLEAMDEKDRIKLFNYQELVNTILTMAEEDSRTVCKRRGRLGTNFKTTTCETVKDRRQRQAEGRKTIDRLLRGTPITSG